MAPNSPAVANDRVTERRRAVALARHYREFEGLSISADRRPPRSLAGDDQGVLLRPDRREGAGGQGSLPWACAAAAARTRSRATARGTPTRTARRATRARSSGAGPRERVLDAMREWRDALRSAAVVVRLVAHARASPWRRAARATQHRRLAFRRRRDRRLRELEGGTGGGRRGRLLEAGDGERRSPDRRS